MRFTFKRACQLLELPLGYDITKEEDFDLALRIWRVKTADARRNGNDDLAADLSQAKEALKRRKSRLGTKCPDCGQGKSKFAARCNVCARRVLFYPNQMNASTPLTEHEIEATPLPVPPRTLRSGILTQTMRELATTGTVGDSFVTSKQSTTIKSVARLLGMEVITRIVTHGKKVAGKKYKVGQQYRVWRSDGKSEKELNEIIKRRLAGEKIESKPCEPPPDVEDIKAKHRGRPAK